MRTLKVLTLAGAALAASVSLASAADMAVKARPMAPIIPISDWTGWYVGVNGSGLWGESDWFYPAFGVGTAPDFDQAFIGVHGGYNIQFPLGGVGLVLGTESSFNAATGYFDGNDGAACPNALITCQTRIGKYFTTGGRLGIAWDRFMIYGSGGFAAGEVNTRGVVNATGARIENTSAWHAGYYFGGGVDFQVYKTAGTAMILGLEYQHVDLGDAFHNPGGVPQALSRNVDVTADVIKAKLTVKLDGPYWFR